MANTYILKEKTLEKKQAESFRLTIGKEVRLKSAYIIKCVGVKKDKEGNTLEVICEYDPESKSGSGTEQSLRKVKGTLHWVTQNDSMDITINSYDRLFKEETPGAKNEGDFLKRTSVIDFKYS